MSMCIRDSIEALQNGGRQNEINDGLSQQVRITIPPLKNWNIIGELNIKSDNNWTHYEHKRVYSHMANDPEKTYVATMTGPSAVSYTHLTSAYD